MIDDEFSYEEEMENFICLDCGVNTDEIGEYYMLTNEVWKEVVPDLTGMLCINCVELRLGRQLWPEDFMDAPLNVMFSIMSVRLLARFYGIPDEETDELLVILQNNKKEAPGIVKQLRIQNLKSPNKP